MSNEQLRASMIDDVKRLRMEGKTIRDIADILGVSNADNVKSLLIADILGEHEGATSTRCIPLPSKNPTFGEVITAVFGKGVTISRKLSCQRYYPTGADFFIEYKSEAWDKPFFKEESNGITRD